MARTLDTTTRQLQRIVALRYNPYFEQEVQKLRQKYEIPQDSEQARDWFKSLLERYPKNTLAFYFRLWLRGKQYLLGLAAFTLAAKQAGVTRLDRSVDSMASICDTEVPLEKDILLHLSSFKVPNAMYFNVLNYVLDGDKQWLDPFYLELGIRFDAANEIGQVLPTAVITGLNHWTTRKQWIDLWDKEVEPYLKSQQLGKIRKAKKRTTFASLEKQMERWSEWYQLAQIQGLGPSRALRKWEKSHPESTETFDLTTITKAIRKFQEIVAPQS